MLSSRPARYVLSACLLAAALLAGGAARAAEPPAGQAGTAGEPTGATLPLTGARSVVVDDARRHLIIAGGRDDTEVVVTDYAGRAVGRLPQTPDASSLALSPDGGTVYVALRGRGEIAAFSTATLGELSRTAVGADTCPSSLVALDRRVWFSHGCSGPFDTGIGKVDLVPSPTVSTGLAPGLFPVRPVLTASVADPDVVFAGAWGTSPSTVHRLELAGDVLASTATVPVGDNLQDLKVTPDGGQLVVADASRDHFAVLAADDLAPAGRYDSASGPARVAFTGDGALFAGGGIAGYAEPDIQVYRSGGTTAVRTYDLLEDSGFTEGTLAWTADGSHLFAVTKELRHDLAILHIYPGPGR
jgi:DNA-binding beta-propeller fold protein YncE